jgi:hypothetical protein
MGDIWRAAKVSDMGFGGLPTQLAGAWASNRGEGICASSS